jgi:phage gpG-like protein
MNDLITINIAGLTDVQNLITRLPGIFDRVTKDPTTLHRIGTTLVASARTTIDQGGRPLYKPLAQSPINRRWKKGQKTPKSKRANKQGIVSNQPLINTGTLIKSLDHEITGTGLVLTSVGYLKYHQWPDGRSKARFPVRPVWGIHDDDRDDITDALIDGIARQIDIITR